MYGTPNVNLTDIKIFEILSCFCQKPLFINVLRNLSQLKVKFFLLRYVAKKFFRRFITDMINVQYKIYTPSFQGKNPLNVKYIMEKRRNLVPDRVVARINEISASKPETMPTLKEIHLEVYAPLLNCKTIGEAIRLFPEFEGMKNITKVVQRITGNYKKLDKNGYLTDKFSLKILQDTWAKLKTQDEIAKDFGLKNRNSLGWILEKIGFVNYPQNYRTLLAASDPVGHSVIAGKTAAWNAAHPDLMRARNKHAAQFCKKPEYRAAQSERMKEYDKLHPERREKIGIFSKEMWENIPEVKSDLSAFLREQDSLTRKAVCKKKSLTETEKRMKKGFYKRFWEKYPEHKEKMQQATASVRAERKINLDK